MNYKLLLAILLISIWSCKGSRNKQSEKSKPAIDQTDYQQLWVEIEQLEKEGKPKSIVLLADSILSLASKNENTPQLFKALVYRSKYRHEVEEDSELKVIQDFEKQIAQWDGINRALLQSAVGELYGQYYASRQWRNGGRSNASNYQKEDIRSWSQDQIMWQAHAYYQASLNEIEILNTTPITHIQEILIPFETSNNNLDLSRKHRPSLFEFLAERALQFYQNTYQQTTIPLQAFTTSDSILFLTYSDFLSYNPTTQDSLSKDFQILSLFQKILKNEIAEKRWDALLDFDLKRLAFAKQMSYHANVNKQYLDALKQVEEQKDWSQTQLKSIKFAQAITLQELGYKYDFLDSSSYPNKPLLTEAFKLAESYEDDSSYYGLNFAQLKKQLAEPSFSIEAENVYPSGEDLLLYTQFKNIDKLHLQLYKVPVDYSFRNKHIRDGWFEMLQKHDLIKSWSTALQVEKDFQFHSTEFGIPALEHGSYCLVASLDSSIQSEKSANGSFLFFQISDLSLASSARENKETALVVRDRISGKGIPHVEVDLLANTYNPQKRLYESHLVKRLATNSKGELSFQNQDRTNYQNRLIKENDTLWNNRSVNSFMHTSQNTKQKKSQLFTDRAIYRPGQIVYFKGVIYEGDRKNADVASNQNTTVKLFDSNRQMVSEFQVKTNAFGSYHGSFILPQGKLNGNFLIKDDFGSTNFQVEEYKRPSFQIEMKAIEEQYALNQEIPISGTIKNYSGFHLGNTPLNYRVIRKATFPYWPIYRSYFPAIPEQEIAQGSLITDEKGEFNFEFIARNDEKVKPEWQSVFHYTIYIEATAENGESQQLTEVIKISPQSLFLTTNLSDWVTVNQLQELVIEAKNINGKTQKSEVQLKLLALETPKTTTKARLWPAIDYQLISDKDYQKKFAAYGKSAQHDLENLPLKNLVVESRGKCNQAIKLVNELKAGAYELQAETKDKNGRLVQYSKRFVVYHKNNNQAAFPIIFKVIENKTKAEVGEKAAVTLVSSVKDLDVLCEVELDGKVIHKEYLKLNNSQLNFTFPIKEQHRGNITFHFSAVAMNRWIHTKKTIEVPFSHKALQLKLKTFRNLVEPGTQEKWSMQVKTQDEKVLDAEILASMYDQSLDAFISQNWNFHPYQNNYSKINWQSPDFGKTHSRRFQYNYEHTPIPVRYYPTLNWFNFSLHRSMYRSMPVMMAAESNSMDNDVLMEQETPSISKMKNDIVKEKAEKQTITFRENFNETAFFYPDLKTDKLGELEFEFTVPDALTQWKFRALAHTKDLKFGFFDTSVVTQKQLMIQVNSPRYFIENDQIIFKASIQNLKENPVEAKTSIRFFNAENNRPIDIIQNQHSDASVFIGGKQSKRLEWALKIPENIQAIRYQIAAETSKHSDGETKVIPVISNKTLITETSPITLRKAGNHEIDLGNLMNFDSKTQEPYQLTIEFSANPEWYVVQALPYLNEADNKQAEEVFYQFFAHSIASHIVKHNPKIQQIFKQWQINSPSMLQSELEKNQSLKNILIEETPWLKSALSEAEQKQRIALLFDINHMSNQQAQSIQQLSKLQLSNGGWSWLEGMPDNRYITASIVSGFGELLKMKVIDQSNPEINKMLNKAIEYLDQEIEDDYLKLIERKVDLTNNHLGPSQIQYLYLKSLFSEFDKKEKNKAFNYYLKQAELYWKDRSLMLQAMQAIALNRLSNSSLAAEKIIASLKEHAIIDEQKGMYWKANAGGYRWNESSIETQAYLMDAFAAVGEYKELIEEMKLWLLHQKRIQHWGTNKSTAKACYALLMQEKEVLVEKESAIIKVGSEKLNTADGLAAIGYVKKSWSKAEISPAQKGVEIYKSTNKLSWGGIYWQYFEDLDQVKGSSTEDLSIQKTVYKEVLSATGVHLEPITNSQLKIGDKVVVRLRIESKAYFEFVHLKDQRASCMEPTDVISSYRYQDGLGYYQNTKDASSHFYFESLPKGVYIFEYSMRLSQAGNFSSGVSQIQSYYAPEFSSTSKGMRIEVMD